MKGSIGKLKIKERRVFVCSDPHFGQDSFYRYNPRYENIMRPQFPDAKTCDEFIVRNHNSVVPSEDSIVYFLGDLAKDMFSAEKYISQMNGEFKILVGGNHDAKFPSFKLLQLFDKMCGACYLGGRRFILTHIPIHPQELRNGLINWHGHTHDNSIIDPQYRSFCYEVNDYHPVEVTSLLK